MKTIKKYRDPWDSMIDSLYGIEFGKILEQFPLEYPYHRLSKSNGKVNLYSDDKEYKVEVSAPGFAKDELNIEIKDGVLNIKGEHVSDTKEEKKNYSRKEFSKCSFDRTFTIPEDTTGEVEAKFENGVIYLSLPKKELPPKVESKKIEIK